MSLRRVSIWLAILAVPLWFAAQQMEGFTYTLKYRDVRSVLARVTEDLGKNGQVWIDGAANRITVQDDSSHMDQIRRLISRWTSRPAISPWIPAWTSFRTSRRSRSSSPRPVSWT